MMLNLPGNSQVTLTVEDLNELLEKTERAGYSNALRDFKKALGFSVNKSFDDILPIIKSWKPPEQEKV
jgi:hypothetical protein